MRLFASGGEARDFTGHINDFGELEKTLKRSVKKGLRLMCREIEMGVAASQLAIQQSSISAETNPAERVGTLFGSDYIPLTTRRLECWICAVHG